MKATTEQIKYSLNRHKEACKDLFENGRDFIYSPRNELTYEAICFHVRLLETRLDERTIRAMGGVA